MYTKHALKYPAHVTCIHAYVYIPVRNLNWSRMVRDCSLLTMYLTTNTKAVPQLSMTKNFKFLVMT